MGTHSMGMCAALALTVASFLVSYVAARRPQGGAASLGHRGLQRQRARLRSPGFRVLDALVRWLAIWLEELRLPTLRAHLERTLRRSGDYLGLNATELMALATVSAALGALVGAYAGSIFDRGATCAVAGWVLGGIAPYMRVRDSSAQRDRQLNHALPPAIDLLSLCMSAGLDFTSALQLVARECPAREAVLQHEIRRILQGLQTGQTRRQALLDFAARTSATCVRDFVSAVVQADEKGTPLSAVLQIQAQVLRMHRSVAAEEAAARAAVLLVLPLLLLMGSILTVMLGPFLINGIGL
jgi:tight adherence protein C